MGNQATGSLFHCLWVVFFACMVRCMHLYSVDFDCFVPRRLFTIGESTCTQKGASWNHMLHRVHQLEVIGTKPKLNSPKGGPPLASTTAVSAMIFVRTSGIRWKTHKRQTQTTTTVQNDWWLSINMCFFGSIKIHRGYWIYTYIYILKFGGWALCIFKWSCSPGPLVDTKSHTTNPTYPRISWILI